MKGDGSEKSLMRKLLLTAAAILAGVFGPVSGSVSAQEETKGGESAFPAGLEAFLEARLLASLEYRNPVASVVGLAAFVDTGQVWRVLENVSPEDYQVAAGVGLLVGTPAPGCNRT